MTRPLMIQADTTGLQHHCSPSVQDHSPQQKQMKREDRQHHVPHQDQFMRQAEIEAVNELVQGQLAPQDRTGHDGHDDDDPTEDGNDQMTYCVGHGDSTGSRLAESEVDDQLEDDFLDKISSSPSIDDEDIDFEFVYALHTFVATVEGQANAAKGDTMVLLDDSNSYWWLVRVVKDGSIGYLPAEHIETPTERLARLNKHRNIDLSATMLGDNAEKSKNPLRKAMRRRNTKTVTFASPTYFEAAEVDFSSDDQDEEKYFFEEKQEKEGGGGVTKVDSCELDENVLNDSDMDIESSPPKQQQQQQQDIQSVMESTTGDGNLAELPTPPNESRSSGNGHEQPVHGRSRHGTVRNTDSFFKDDTVETKKISLTPNLLRDDASSVSFYEPNEAKGRGISETYDKSGNSGDKGKDDRKRKDKKPGMLSGLFKRKDRKAKTLEDDSEEPEKVSGESIRSYTPSNLSSDSLRDDSRTLLKSQTGLHRNISKHQEPQSHDLSPVKEAETSADILGSPVSEENAKSSLRLVSLDSQVTAQSLQVHSSETSQPTTQSHAGGHEDVQPLSASKPTRATTAASSDSAPNLPANQRRQKAEPNTSSDDKNTPFTTPQHRETEKKPDLDNGTTAEIDSEYFTTLPKEGQRDLLQSAAGSSSELPGASGTKPSEKPEEQQRPSSGPAWNDATLRAYFDDGREIRDLLILIQDRSNVTPMAPDHPVTWSLFKEERRALGEMSIRLDDLLSSWLTRKCLTFVQ
ncbi:hypothetical protein VTO42DRAFT_4095 [Malbranchea cinnamomea]